MTNFRVSPRSSPLHAGRRAGYEFLSLDANSSIRHPSISLVGSPFAGQSLCLGELCRGQRLGDDVSILDRDLAILANGQMRRREIGVHMRFDIVLLDTVTVGVH